MSTSPVTGIRLRKSFFTSFCPRIREVQMLSFTSSDAFLCGDSGHHQDQVCCWFFPLLREVFLRVPRFSLLLNNSTRNQVDEEPLCGCSTCKSLFIYLFIIYLFIPFTNFNQTLNIDFMFLKVFSSFFITAGFLVALLSDCVDLLFLDVLLFRSFPSLTFGSFFFE